VIEPGDDNDLVLVAYNLDDGEVELKAPCSAPKGTRSGPGRLSLVERTVTGIGGLDKLLARFQVGELAGGRYTLRVALEQAGNGRGPGKLHSVQTSPTDPVDRSDHPWNRTPESRHEPIHPVFTPPARGLAAPGRLAITSPLLAQRKQDRREFAETVEVLTVEVPVQVIAGGEPVGA
jgi:hypothetical protein